MSSNKSSLSSRDEHLEKSPETISQHKKSIKASSSKLKKAQKAQGEKNIEKPGSDHDDWNDPTGNSHISSSEK